MNRKIWLIITILCYKGLLIASKTHKINLKSKILIFIKPQNLREIKKLIMLKTIKILWMKNLKKMRKLKKISNLLFSLVRENKSLINRVFSNGKFLVPKILDFCPKVGLSPIDCRNMN